MADKNTLAQMLEHLVNDDQQKAEELFHEYIVAKSREIYEGLIEDELKDEEVDESSDSDEEEVDESSESDEEEVDENFGEAEGDMPFGDEEEEADPTDNLTGELDAEMGDDEGEESPDEEAAEKFQELKDIVDELEALWDEKDGMDSDMGSDMDSDMDDEKPMKDDFDDGSELETVREYVEKVPAGHGAEKKGAAEKADGDGGGLKFVKNDMGGTTANILSGRNGAAGSETGALKGNGLLKGSPKEDNAGNINVPGAKNGNAFSKKEPGHGAEKKGAAEQADNKQSLFRGRR